MNGSGRVGFPMVQVDSRPLLELVCTVRRRTTRATDLIARSDAPDVIDREMRYIRPFWEFYSARRRINSQRYWERTRRELFGDTTETPFHRTPLVWLPRCDVVVSNGDYPEGHARRRMLNLLSGLDGAIFNFIGLMGRMRHTLGFGDQESFHVETTEEGEHGYQLLYRILARSGQGGGYRILTCQFQLPNGEYVKIEKDYSRGRSDVSVSIRLHGRTQLRGLRFDGTQAELRKHRGGELRIV